MNVICLIISMKCAGTWSNSWEHCVSRSVLCVGCYEWRTALSCREWIEITYLGLRKQEFCSVYTTCNMKIPTGLILDSVLDNIWILHDMTPYSLVDTYLDVGENCHVHLQCTVNMHTNEVWKHRLEHLWNYLCSTGTGVFHNIKHISLWRTSPIMLIFC